MTPHDITLRERVDELEDENMRLNMRISELEIKCAEQKKQITKFKQAIDAYRVIRER